MKKLGEAHRRTPRKEETLVLFLKRSLSGKEIKDWDAITKSIWDNLDDNCQLEPVDLEIFQIDDKKYEAITLEKILKALIEKKS